MLDYGTTCISSGEMNDTSHRIMRRAITNSLMTRCLGGVSMTPFDALLVERAPGIGQSARRARLMIALSFIIAPIALPVLFSSKSDRQFGSQPHAIYDSDPAHLWNRLHRALYVRSTRKGEEYGRDELDPLLWEETDHLLVGPSHQQAIKLLDEFLSKDSAS